MRTLVPLALLLAVPAMAAAQPSGWSASIGASAPEPPAATIQITRPVNADELDKAIARPSQACEIKPVMTDEDYRRCGARPPDYSVDFAAPWPRDKAAPSRRRAGG